MASLENHGKNESRKTREVIEIAIEIDGTKRVSA